MRIATLVIGLLVGLMLVLQSFAAGAFSGEGTDTSLASGAGIMMALLWLLASALVIAFPFVSTVLYALSIPLGLFTPTGAFEDLRFHGVVAIVLTVMAFLGWRGKKKNDVEVASEKARQAHRDTMLEQMLRNQYAGSTSASTPTVSTDDPNQFTAVPNIERTA